MGLGVSPRGERWAVMAWLAIYLVCAAFGVYTTAKTAADLVEEERTRSESGVP